MLNPASHKPCILCGSKDIVVYLDVEDHSISGETFRLLRCMHCEFIWTQEPPAESEIGRYYTSEDYISHTDTRKGMTASLYHRVRKFMLSRKRRMVEKHCAAQGTLLDFGCGTGYFLQEMAENGWKVVGMEPDPGARQIATERSSLDVREPDLTGIPDSSLDVITLWHVLEHIHQLRDTIRQMERIIKPGGVLLIAVPNAGSWDARHYGRFWAAYDVPRHLWHFNRKALSGLLQKSEFQFEELRSLPFDVFYVALLSERYKGGILALPEAFLKGIFGRLMSSLDIEHSSSLVYIYRRRQD